MFVIVNSCYSISLSASLSRSYNTYSEAIHLMKSFTVHTYAILSLSSRYKRQIDKNYDVEIMLPYNDSINTRTHRT